MAVAQRSVTASYYCVGAALKPSLIIANLLLDLQQQIGLAFVFISHDLGVVEHIEHRVAVIGRIVDLVQGEALFANPIYPGRCSRQLRCRVRLEAPVEGECRVRSILRAGAPYIPFAR